MGLKVLNSNTKCILIALIFKTTLCRRYYDPFFKRKTEAQRIPEGAGLDTVQAHSVGFQFCAGKLECVRSQKPEGESCQNGLSARLNAAERLKV